MLLAMLILAFSVSLYPWAVKRTSVLLPQNIFITPLRLFFGKVVHSTADCVVQSFIIQCNYQNRLFHESMAFDFYDGSLVYFHCTSVGN